VKVIVATSGFGVGIDYSAVRVVIKFGFPYSFVDLLQQSGRAGRDGQAAKHILPGVNRHHGIKDEEDPFSVWKAVRYWHAECKGI